jgi:hypothetical protein
MRSMRFMRSGLFPVVDFFGSKGLRNHDRCGTEPHAIAAAAVTVPLCLPRGYLRFVHLLGHVTVWSMGSMTVELSACASTDVLLR